MSQSKLINKGQDRTQRPITNAIATTSVACSSWLMAFLDLDLDWLQMGFGISTATRPPRQGRKKGAVTYAGAPVCRCGPGGQCQCRSESKRV